jgi:LmbE family N-acetylglucosaminyl deacetylase
MCCTKEEMKILLAPHNDDESLWTSFTCLRERPHVIVCLRSFVQARYGITYQQREAETAMAMDILGCTWEQWDISDEAPRWAEIEQRFRALSPEHAWAPLPEQGGHNHHNKIGKIAVRVWPGKVTQYLTYTNAGKSVNGTLVPYVPSMINAKLRALQCYRSQILEPSCCEHFIRSQHEYVA